MIPVLAEEAKVGATLELVADTKYALLGFLTELRIHYKQRGKEEGFLPASQVAEEPTKARAVMPSETNDTSGNMRLWVQARGTGTIVFIGKTRILRVLRRDG